MPLVIYIVSISLISTRKQCCFSLFSTVSAKLISTVFASHLEVEFNFSLQPFFLKKLEGCALHILSSIQKLLFQVFAVRTNDFSVPVKAVFFISSAFFDIRIGSVNEYKSVSLGKSLM